MLKYVITAVAAAAALTGCAATSNAPTAPTSPTPSASASLTEDPYDAYVAQAAKLKGAKVISQQDAAIRAQLVCSDPAQFSVPLKSLPTDYALVLAYCPSELGKFK